MFKKFWKRLDCSLPYIPYGALDYIKDKNFKVVNSTTSEGLYYNDFLVIHRYRGGDSSWANKQLDVESKYFIVQTIKKAIDAQEKQHAEWAEESHKRDEYRANRIAKAIKENNK